MPEENQPIVIIGTGLAGYSLVRELRKLDRETPVLLITADDGHSYSKPMLSTGFTKAKTAEELSMGDPGKMAEQFNVSIRTFATVTRIDTSKKQISLGDELITYAKLVLAWGADVINLDIPGSGASHVYSVNDLLDYRRVREALDGKQRVIIMGAGLIGCEFANDLRNGGFDVDVVAPCETALPGLLPEAAGQAVTRGLEESGVRFHFNTSVKRIDRISTGVRAEFSNGERIEADLVLSAIGLRPRISSAKLSGLHTEQGIIVNRALETSAEDVYALGDCAEVDGYVMLYVLPLMACARALAKTLTGDRTEVSYSAMPVIVKTPACPVAVSPPAKNAVGKWHTEQDGELNVRALFKDGSDNLLGFALTGSYVLEKQKLVQLLPPIHD